MKTKVFAIALAGAVVAAPAMGDTLAGLYVGAQAWQQDTSGGFADSNSVSSFNFDDETNSAAYIALEHPIPLVPNIKLNYTTMDTGGSTSLNDNFTFDGELFPAGTEVMTVAELTTTDFILYYELFDNDLISFDIGVNGKYIDGTFSVEESASNTMGTQDFSGVIPMLYSRVQVGLPFTGLGAYAEGSYLSFDDHEVSDYQVALTYSFIESLAIDMTLQLGYRNAEINIEDLDDIYADMTFDGAFAGLEIHF
ncbi:TIGR04219 family outer membrane beta-barrel protein [Alteromonas aestuariivivens]|uniref:TIGR04219 family outer membrane beta-barrel protein n=1 Tax=Alteromonas aestuariivivens TaxID=1938339 RepID=A0A3D8M315_9ALTE|nr:TIGR04219 family outer membrane beta-barrel protein [Alteromonas aestuariivivens]RDV24018.1 TIGR04219 family outer membrane beta-barrel protein [Alteromonas aestuariivivens]